MTLLEKKDLILDYFRKKYQDSEYDKFPVNVEWKKVAELTCGSNNLYFNELVNYIIEDGYIDSTGQRITSKGLSFIGYVKQDEKDKASKNIIEKDIRAKHRPILRPGRSISSGMTELKIGIINDGGRATIQEIRILEGEVIPAIKTPFVIEGNGTNRSWGINILNGKAAGVVPYKLQYIYKDELDIYYSLIVNYNGPGARFEQPTEINPEVPNESGANQVEIETLSLNKSSIETLPTTTKKTRGGNTVLVIGAGVSKDIHSCFGLGTDLLIQIKEQILDSSSAFDKILVEELKIPFDKLRRFSIAFDYYIQCTEYPSIDNFIDEAYMFDEYEEDREFITKVGHLAIIYNALSWEQELRICIEEGKTNLTETWVSEVIKFIEEEDLLKRYADSEILSTTSLQIVTFNYDRVLEYILLVYFKNSTEIKEWIANNVFHVYGQIADIEQVEFGFDSSNIKELEPLVNNIITINEIREQFKQQRNVKMTNYSGIRQNWDMTTAIVNANARLLVLGFGFDKNNTANIGLDKLERRITVLGHKNGDDIKFESRRNFISKVKDFSRRTDISFKGCKKFLEEHLNYEVQS